MKQIKILIKDENLRKRIQNGGFNNIKHLVKDNSILIDKLRERHLINKFFTKKPNKPLRIIHVTNFNERHNGRLFFNTGRRLNNGLYTTLLNVIFNFIFDGYLCSYYTEKCCCNFNGHRIDIKLM